MESTLFRFITIRNPQLLSQKEKEKGFVFNESSAQSRFVKSIDKTTEAKAKKEALKTASDSFSEIKTLEEVRSIDTNMYDFSFWLMKNKNILTRELLENYNTSNTVKKLTAANRNKIWENLLFQTVTNQDSNIREACIQMLVANNFVVKNDYFSDTPEDVKLIQNINDLRKLAKTSVVIPKDLVTNPPSSTVLSNVSTADFDESMQDELQVAIRRENIKNLEKVIQEIRKVDDDLNVQIQREFDSASVTYSEQSETMLDDILSENTTSMILRSPEEEKNVDASKESIPRVDIDTARIRLPKFEFKPTEIFTPQYLQDKISPSSFALIENLNLEKQADCDQVISAVEQVIQIENDAIFEMTTRSEPRVLLNGATITRSRVPRIRYCYSIMIRRFLLQGPIYDGPIFGDPIVIEGPIFQEEPDSMVARAKGLNNNTLPVSISMNLNAGYNNAKVIKIKYKIGLEDGQKFTGTEVRELIGTGNNSILISFFPRGLQVPINLDGGDMFFSGELTLNNNTKLSFNTTIPIKNTTRTGCAIIANDDSDGGGDTGSDDPSPKPTFFGITKIGVADFRRVDQEVCCYVPGEVSHIENILAREYKERSTRRLLSSESSSESSTEKETETLTDTTTTERNELQIEVSEVLNEDESQNFGASTGVSGSYGAIKFNANAYGDFASSSASSNSSSTAQSYAQEITQRTLDRVVQKVNKKRTSRILKEFEENNKHGFDNRLGDQHVTGIYRWVDKIYKNKLVNYGKRLMYEFMVPEPSRFFKEAIIKEATESGSTTEQGVILPEPPTSPKSKGYNSGKDLNKWNYQALAAYYNAQVDAPPSEYNYVGTYFTKSATGGDGDNRQNKAEGKIVSIPQGYVAIAAKTTGNSIGGQRHIAVGGLYLPLNSFTFRNIYPHYQDEVPVSALFDWNWVSNINVVIRCKRTDEAYQQWQNETYAAILDAYKDRVDEYNLSLEVNNNGATSGDAINFNPLLNRTLEKRELKRNAIEMLTKPFGIDIGRDNLEVTGSNVPSITLNENFEKYTRTVKFFEQAFEWEIMAYLFYPYYWADKGDWKTLFQKSNGTDPIFQAFLQSGMARMVVPVRPGFEEAVVYYLETGEVFNGDNLALDLDNDLYLSIVDELKPAEPVIEEEWETRLPTDLTIVQAESAALNESGLPCYCDQHKAFDSSMVTLGGGSGIVNTPKANTLIYNEDDNDGIDEFRFRVYDDRGEIILSSSKKYATEALATQALDTTIIQITERGTLDADNSAVEIREATDGRFYFVVFDTDQKIIARKSYFDTKPQTEAAVNALRTFVSNL